MPIPRVPYVSTLLLSYFSCLLNAYTTHSQLLLILTCSHLGTSSWPSWYYQVSSHHLHCLFPSLLPRMISILFSSRHIPCLPPPHISSYLFISPHISSYLFISPHIEVNAYYISSNKSSTSFQLYYISSYSSQDVSSYALPPLLKWLGYLLTPYLIHCVFVATISPFWTLQAT